ncbi:protein of unknown function DUF1058 [Solidesulfovibrio fructosivorans JJ]]|uniref:Uncharacterized protein n=1 Tax=Solidesulfovibrio fructosivorans JJ] TaxID=596151 RepID=E1JRF8_SOLFR|nr:hypothetical protein [Solidesulfovibrio fructosivorans]EFL53159.1 protein of unknown function DUF1058 [Solidesulfovibrio fructosivorans JJ]]
MGRFFFFRSLTPVWIMLLALLVCGCQKTVRGLGVGNVAYTKRQTFVLAAPDPNASVVASLGANVSVTVSSSKNAFRRVDFDNGRVVGWVREDALSSSTVKETAPAAQPARRAPTKRVPAASAKAAKDEGAVAKDATSAPPVDTPQAVETPPAAPASTAPAAAQAPTAPEAAPPAAKGGSGGILSPKDAQAAPPPRAPATGKQANPEAFDPF